MRKTSIANTHLRSFELGNAGMGIAKLKELATLYGCTIDELVAEVEQQELTP
jgi:hypothetical protein